MAKKVDTQRAIAKAHQALSEGEADEKTLPELRAVLSAAVRSNPTPISVVPRDDDDDDDDDAPKLQSWDRQLIDVAIVELALSLDVPIRTPPGDPRSYTFWLYRWAQRAPNPLDELRRVEAHPFFGEVLVASFFPTRETKDEVGNWLARAVAIPDGFRRVFAALDAFGDTLLETWPVGALETHEEWLGHLCQPAVFARCPRLARAVRALTPARLLRNQLRAGIMDEWGSPAQEAALARLRPDRDLQEFADSGPYPYRVLFDKNEGRAVAYGPDGVVFDKVSPASKKMKDVRRMFYLDGDVFLAAYGEPSRWAVDKAKPFKLDCYDFFDVGADGGVLTRSLRVFRKGDSAMPKGKSAGYQDVWSDGERFYAVPGDVLARRDGTPLGSDSNDPITTFDPKTGKKLGHDLPAWMASVVGDGAVVVDGSTAFTLPAPKGAEQGPLGAKGGLVGSALVLRDGEVFVEGIDGRRAPGLVNGLYTAALMTFPAREGFYRVVQSGGDLGIALPDGTTPLIQSDRISHRYWAGSTPLPLTHWALLRPRDLEASRALAACSDEAAQAIFDAVEPPQDGEEDAPPSPALLAAVSRALPEVTHPSMVAGVAGIALEAADSAAVVTRLRTQVTSLASPKSDLRNDDVAALSRLFEHDRHWWIEKLGIQLGQQIQDVSTFLFASELDDRIATPAPTVVPWPLMLVRMGEILYRVLAPGTPIPKRDELVKALGLWLETGFPRNLARLRLVTMAVPKNTPELAGLDSDHPQRLVRWGNRYHLCHVGTREGLIVVSGIEASADGVFRVPAGAVLDEAQDVDVRFDEPAIRRTLSLFAERRAAKFDRAIAARISAATKLSTAAATLLWSAGYDPWLMSEAKLARFGVSRDALESAEREVRSLPLGAIYAHAMPKQPEQMYDGAVMADRLIEALTRVPR